MKSPLKQEAFAGKPDFMQYETLLKRLHILMAEGKGDTDEAEAVRDQMDVAWGKLNREEIARLNGLSSDLYMLTDEEMPQPFQTTLEQLRAELSRAWEQRDAQATLHLLRQAVPFLPADNVASLRAGAYAELGHLESALLFARYAADRNPSEASHKLRVLDLLLRLGRIDEARALTSSYVAETSLSSPLASVVN